MLVVVAVAFLGFRALVLWLAYPTEVAFDIAIRSHSVPDSWLRGCFYYDVGSGFSEERKACVAYERQPAQQFQRYRVRLRSVADLQRLRADPADHPGSITLRNIRITTAGTTHDVVFELDLGRTLLPLQAAELEPQGRELHMEMTGSDSQIMLCNRMPGRTAASERRVLAGAAAGTLLLILATMGLGAAVRSRVGAPEATCPR